MRRYFERVHMFQLWTVCRLCLYCSVAHAMTNKNNWHTGTVLWHGIFRFNSTGLASVCTEGWPRVAFTKFMVFHQSSALLFHLTRRFFVFCNLTYTYNVWHMIWDRSASTVTDSRLAELLSTLGKKGDSFIFFTLSRLALPLSQTQLFIQWMRGGLFQDKQAGQWIWAIIASPLPI